MSQSDDTQNLPDLSHGQDGALDDSQVMVVGKLDADEYSAEDLDGITESLFGSGNLSFLSLQAGQTNDAIALNETMVPESNASFLSESAVASGFVPTFDGNFSDSNQFNGKTAGIAGTDTDRMLDTGGHAGVEDLTNHGNFSNTTVGSLGAVTLSSDIGKFSPAGGMALHEGSQSSNTATTAIENHAGTTANTVVNEVINHGGDLVENTLHTVNETIENVTNLGDNIISNLLEGDTTELVNTVVNEVSEITETVNNVLETLNLGDIVNLGDVVNEVINNDTVQNITNTATTLVDNTIDTVQNITNTATTIVDNTVNTVTNLVTDLLGGGHLALDLNTDALGSLGLGAGVVVEDTITGAIDTSLLSGGAGTLINGLTGLDLPLVADTGANIGFNLLNGGDGTDNATGDSDLSINGLDIPGVTLPDIALDPVETIVGDIDISLNVPSDLTDPQGLVEGVQDVAGNLGNLDLADAQDVVDLLGAESADGGLGVDLFGNEMGQDFDLTGNDIVGNLETTLDEGAGAVDDLLATGGDVTSLSDSLSETLDTVTGDTSDVTDVIDPLTNALEDTLGSALDTGTISDTVQDGVDQGVGIIDDITGSQDLTDPVSSLLDASGTNDNSGTGLIEQIVQTTEDTVDQAGNVIGDISGQDGLTDPVETLLGTNVDPLTQTLDSDLSDALDLLGGTQSASDSGSTDIVLDSLWTDSTSGDGGLFGDIISGTSGSTDILPDTGGSVAEGIGALDVPSGGSGGGLLGGGGHLGGLFH